MHMQRKLHWNPHKSDINGHFISEDRLWSQRRPCRICRGQSDTGRGFSASNSAFPSQYKSINAPYWHFIHLSSTLHNINNSELHSIKTEPTDFRLWFVALILHNTAHILYVTDILITAKFLVTISLRNFRKEKLIHMYVFKYHVKYPYLKMINLWRLKSARFICYKNSVSFSHRMQSLYIIELVVRVCWLWTSPIFILELYKIHKYCIVCGKIQNFLMT